MKKRLSIIAMGLALVLAMSAFTGCGKSLADPGNLGSTVAATIGDDTIYMDEANFFVRYSQWGMESYYWAYYQYIGYASMWDAPGGDNPDQSLATVVKQSVMNELLQTRILMKKAPEYNVTLTDADKETVKGYVHQVMDGLTDEFYQYANVTEEQLTTWYENNALANKVQRVIRDQAEVNVSEEDCKMFTVRYLMIPDNEDFEGQTLNEGVEIDTAKAEAEYLVKHVQDGEDFETLVAEFDGEATLRSYPVKDEERTDQPAIIGAGLKTGEITMEHVDTEEETGWYVVYCVSDNDADAAAEQRETLEEEQRDTYFESIYTGWTEGVTFEVKDAYNDLTVSYGEMIYAEPTEAETEATTEAGTEATTEAGTGEVTEAETGEVTEAETTTAG